MKLSVNMTSPALVDFVKEVGGDTRVISIIAEQALESFVRSADGRKKIEAALVFAGATLLPTDKKGKKDIPKAEADSPEDPAVKNHDVAKNIMAGVMQSALNPQAEESKHVQKKEAPAGGRGLDIDKLLGV